MMNDASNPDDPHKNLREQAEKLLRDETVALPEKTDFDALLHELRVHQTELDLQNAQLREAQEQLEVSRRRYYDLFDLAPVGYFLLDANLLVAEVNLAGAEMFSTSRKSLTGRPFLLRVNPEYHDAFIAHRDQAIRTQGNPVCELQMIRQDGGNFWARLQSSILLDPSRQSRCLTTVVDITRARQSQEELADSEARYRLIFETAGVMIVHLDMHGRILDINQRAAATLGQSRDALRGRTLVDYVPEEDRQAATSRIRQALACDVNDFETRLQAPGGRCLRVNANITSMQTRAGGQRTILCLIEDVTHRKELEQRLHQAETMEAVGRLAGGVAHDFRNQLTVVKGYCELLLAQGGKLPEDDLHDSLEQIRQATDRATDTTSQLLAFSRSSDIAPEHIELNAFLQEMLDPLQRMLGEDVEVTLKPTDEPTDICCERTHLQQALLKLAGNAREAMPSGGRLLLSTTRVNLKPNAEQALVDLPAGPYVQLAVRDTGRGIPPENQQHIFEPFYSTKSPAEAAGLGLAVVYGFAKRTGGSVEVASQPGQGATFTLLLPAVGETSPAEEQPQPHDAPQRQQTILVVEDDPSVRKLVTLVLREQGFEVIDVNDPTETLRISREHHGPIDLLLSDIVMPGISGLSVAAQVTADRPETRVLYISGYTAETVGANDILRPGQNLLPKPFTPQDLVQAVWRVLRDAPKSKNEPAGEFDPPEQDG